MPPVLEVPIECPRCNGEQKFVNVDKEDETHTRTCPRCNYSWQYRDGMPSYPGEFEPAAEAAPAVDAAPPAETPAETVTPTPDA